MPEGRSIPMPRCGPPGILPSTRPREFSLGVHRLTTISNLSNILQVKHNHAQKTGSRTYGVYSNSSRIAGFCFHQLIAGRILAEPPGIEITIYKSRTRLPANKRTKTRDLRHGCQRSKTLTPIMEE
jgi:hypothetical protein